MIELIKPFLPEIITGVLGLGAWANERNKRKQEVKQAQIDLTRAETQNIQAVVDLYQEALTDLKNRYDGTISELKAQYDLKFAVLESDVKKLRENVNLWKTKYATLKKDFDQYRANHK